MTDSWTASVASADAYTLGEGPLWDAARERVLWVDIAAGAVHTGHLVGERVAPDAVHHVDRTVGAVACSAAGDLLVAGRTSLAVVAADGTITRGSSLLPSSSRFNDGKCDPAGTFLAGSLNLAEAPGSEVLLRFGPAALATIDDDLTLSNGLGWSPDGTVFYSTDTLAGVVYRRSYDAVTGAVGEREVFLRIGGGVPDGMTVDAAGDLWVAVWGAGEVRRFTPDGEQTGVVYVDAPHSSSAAFIGPDLDLLLITTAQWDLLPDDLRRYPLSGRLFTARVGATGQPVAPWRPHPLP
jgi:sugar lactone lactonase YvrE